LRPLFAKYGTVLSIRSATINPTRFVGGAARRRAKAEARGPHNRCFLSFSSATEAAAAIATLDCADLQGRKLSVKLAEDQGVRDGTRRPVASTTAYQEEAEGAVSLPDSFCSRSSHSEANRQQQQEAAHAENAEGVCSMCGKHGHFAQGCPLTLGSRSVIGPAARMVSTNGRAVDAEKKAHLQALALAALHTELVLAIEADKMRLVVGPSGTVSLRIAESRSPFESARVCGRGCRLYVERYT
jgi:hypothetical protein